MRTEIAPSTVDRGRRHARMTLRWQGTPRPAAYGASSRGLESGTRCFGMSPRGEIASQIIVTGQLPENAKPPAFANFAKNAAASRDSRIVLPRLVGAWARKPDDHGAASRRLRR